ncbi:MAG: hypothetical protein QF441_05495 [Bacteriovoracaceae bacterium]|jgi:hypothetical protein|nr:hypothetical protein [Bacteriovoracaceae bacterium]
MLVDIQVIEKPFIHTKAIFEIENIKTDRDFKETLAIIFMLSAEYCLDPELELDELKEIYATAVEKQQNQINLYLSEDGIEIDFS